MPADVLPFLTVDPGHLSLSPWALIRNGEEEPLPYFLPEWDYLTHIRIQRNVTLNLTDILVSAGLDEGTPRVGWSVSWRATDSKLTGTTTPTEITADNHQLSADIPGSDLGAALDIHTRLVLLEDQERRPGVASEAGSILFSDTHRLDLIGSQPQFPVTVIDFDAAGLDSDASFVVELANDPSMPVLSGLQLLINEKDSQLVEACRRGHTKTQPQKALLEQLDETVFLRLIEYAVDRADSLDYEQWETDSLGRVCAMLADQSGGVVELAEMRRRRLSSYQATVAGAARRRGMGRQL